MRTILALLLLTTSAAFAQITPLRNAVLQNRLEANGHPIQNVGNLTVTAGNVTVGTASLGSPEVPGTPEITTITINATADVLAAAGYTLTIYQAGVMNEWRLWLGTEGPYADPEAGNYWYENENGNAIYLEDDTPESVASALALGMLGYSLDTATSFSDGNVVTYTGQPGISQWAGHLPPSPPDATTSNATLVAVQVTQQGVSGEAATGPSGTGVVVTTTGNVTRIVDGTVQQSGGGDTFVQEGTGKLWRLKITGTESAPVLTLQSID